MKPLATLMEPLQSVNLATNVPASAHVERSDVCAVPSAAVIGSRCWLYRSPRPSSKNSGAIR